MMRPEFTDSGQSDLLELVAMGSPATGSADQEWLTFVEALHRASLREYGGVIDPNRLRGMVRGEVAPRRIGAFTSRAVARGLIAPTGGWVVSTDKEGRNGGRPCREYRWTGGAS
jgi:hypothetical protein